MLEVQQFEFEEITIKVVERHVTMEGKHEEKILREFIWKYLVLEQCDIDELQSSKK